MKIMLAVKLLVLRMSSALCLETNIKCLLGCPTLHQIHQIKAIGTIFGECSNYKSGLRILIWPLEVPFLWSESGHFYQNHLPSKINMTNVHFSQLVQQTLCLIYPMSVTS